MPARGAALQKEERKSRPAAHTILNAETDLGWLASEGVELNDGLDSRPREPEVGRKRVDRRRRITVKFPLAEKLHRTRHRAVDVDGLKIFYREAGVAASQALLLLHGFPTSSHMFRDLIPALADDYHVVAPDLPGFGFSEAPERVQFRYTFDHLADVIDRFTTVAGLTRYAIYVFDYGAPVGFPLAARHPHR